MSWLYYFLVFLATFFLGGLIPFDNLDFNLAALLGWIKCTLAALSKAEKTAFKFVAVFSRRAFLIKAFKAISRFLFRAVLSLSFLTFLMADLMSGMLSMVT